MISVDLISVDYGTNTSDLENGNLHSAFISPFRNVVHLTGSQDLHFFFYNESLLWSKKHGVDFALNQPGEFGYT